MPHLPSTSSREDHAWKLPHQLAKARGLALLPSHPHCSLTPTSCSCASTKHVQLPALKLSRLQRCAISLACRISPAATSLKGSTSKPECKSSRRRKPLPRSSAVSWPSTPPPPSAIPM